jgi:hypothetical protein
MARILICHVPKDGSLARELGAALMGRGHFVSFDGEPDNPRLGRFTRLRQFEAVMVLWTDHSAQSEGLADIARESLPHNLLISLRAAELPITKLPLVFRKLNMLAPRDFEAVSRVVARMNTAASSLREMAERDAARKSEAGEKPAEEKKAAAAQPPPQKESKVAAKETAPVANAAAPSTRQPDGATSRPPAVERRVDPPVEPLKVPRVSVTVPEPPRAAPQPQWTAPPVAAPRPTTTPPPQMLTAEDLSRAVDEGLLLHRIPPAMWLGSQILVEIELNRDVLAHLVRGHAAGPSIDTLSLTLIASRDAFDIERQTERTQFVSAIPTLNAQDAANFGRWVWLVTPGAAGYQDLVIRISALLRDARGVPAPVAIPDRRFSVDVQIPEDETLGSYIVG